MTVRKRTTLGIVHVTAAPPGWYKSVAGIRATHRAQGCSDIGTMKSSIRMAELRWTGKMAVGAHVAGFNSISLQPVYSWRRQCQ